MLNAHRPTQTLWQSLLALWQRLITGQMHITVTQPPDLTLYGRHYPQAFEIGRRFPISPEYAATMYRAADEAF